MSNLYLNILLFALFLFTNGIKLNTQNFLGKSMVDLDEILIDDYVEDGIIEDVPTLLSDLKTFMKEAELVMNKIDKYENKIKSNESPDNTTPEPVPVNITVVENNTIILPESTNSTDFLNFRINNRTYEISTSINKAPISEILTILNAEIGFLKDSYSDITETNKETSKYIQELRELVTSITNKYNLYTLEKDHKVEIMNRKALEHLHLQLQSALFAIKQNIEVEKEEITDYNLKIEEIIEKLPNEESGCHLIFNCGECVADSTCGWCASSNRCVEGNEFSPHKGQCSYYSFNKCSEQSDCGTYSTCKDCLADVGCGWCNGLNTKSCIRKTDGEKGLCRSTQFYHIWRSENNQCPKVSLTNYFDYVNKELEAASKEPIPLPVVRIDIPNTREIIDLNEDLIEYFDKKEQSEELIEIYEKEYNNTLENLQCVEKEQNKTIISQLDSTDDQQSNFCIKLSC
jgi:hypothetical protein